MRPLKLLLSILLGFILAFAADSVWARGGFRGGGGGGFRGGGGGGFSGGGFSGAPRPAANRSPSMSRALPSRPSNLGSPSINRPNVNRPANSRPSFSNNPAGRGGIGNANRGSGPGSSRMAQPPSGRAAFQSAQSFERPTNKELGSFLNLPSSNTPAASRGANSAARSDGSNSRSYTTAGGTTITVGGGKGSHTTAGGATIGGAGGGIKVETAGGDTIVKGSGAVGAKKGDSAAVAAGSRTGISTAGGNQAVGGRGVRAATDGQNSAIRAGGGVAARDNQGNAVAAGRGGYADSSGYRQGGAFTARKDSSGYSRVNVAGGYSQNGHGEAFRGSAIKGPGGNVVSAGRGGRFVNGQFVGGHAWTAVNGHYTHWGYFGPGYYRRYPGAWWPGKWAVATTAWYAATWAVAGPYCGCDGGGTYYDYGENITYQDGDVYYGDQQVASSEEYYDQASDIAEAGDQTKNDDWLPLGVFAVISEPDQDHTDKVVQLALNKEGAIRGNLQDMLTDKVTPVVGSVDKKTQRVAMHLEGNDSVVVETGLYNLTNDEIPVLVHFGPDKQEDRTLIRLKKPADEEHGDDSSSETSSS